MKQGLLEEVKSDYEKKYERRYNLLYTLYESIPVEFQDKLEYNDEDDGLFFDGRFISNLKELDYTMDDIDDKFNLSIEFSRGKEFMHWTFKHCQNENGHWGWHKYKPDWIWDSI